jgi:two-component system cell cycle sensor histidine kinase/response regulator CckA
MKPVHKDLLVILAVIITAVLAAFTVDMFDLFSRAYESSIYFSGADELIFILALLSPVLIWFSYRRWKDQKAEIALRKKVEENLLSRVRFFQTLIDTIPSPIFYKNMEGRYIGCNKAFEQFIQRPREEIIGKTVYEMAPKNIADMYYMKDIELFEQKERQQYEWKTIDSSRVVHDVLFDKAAFTDANGNPAGLIGVITDITERKRLEMEMLRSQKRESLEILAGGIAHDFNNMLTSIIGNINLAAIKLGRDDPASVHLGAAEVASLKARDLVRQLMTFAKGSPPVKTVISFRQIMLDSISLSMSGSNVSCDCHIPDDLWPVEGDPVQLGQVVSNLIINARQAMPDGGTVLISVDNFNVDKDFQTLKKGRYIRLSVHDEGVGISEFDKSRIFDPYFTTKESGSGLGLATAYSIIQKHAGMISVDSAPGPGTTFIVYIPAVGSNH